MSASSDSAVFNIAGSNYLQFNNSVTGQGNQIGYNLANASTGGSLSTSLDIVGNGNAGSRTIKLWDHVTINKDFLHSYVKMTNVANTAADNDTYRFIFCNYFVDFTRTNSGGTTVAYGNNVLAINSNENKPTIILSGPTGVHLINDGTNANSGSLFIKDNSLTTKASITNAGTITGTSLVLGTGEITSVGAITSTGVITTSGNITTTSPGSITAANGLTVTAGGLTITGGDLKLGSGPTTRIANDGAITANGITSTTGINNIDASTAESVLKAITKTAGNNSTDVATTGYVDTAISYFVIPYFDRFDVGSVTNVFGTFTGSTSSGSMWPGGAFTDKNTLSSPNGNSWSTSNNTYEDASPFVCKNTYNSILGEYLQIELPYSLKLTSYILAPNATTGKPSIWSIYGSANGSSWTKITEQSTAYGWSTNTTVPVIFTCSPAPTISYKYFRLVITNINNANRRTGVSFWNLLGTPDIGINGFNYFKNTSIINKETAQTITAAKTFSGGLTANGITATTGTINIDASTAGSSLKAITKTAGDNSTFVATTAYVDGASTKSQEFAIPYFNSSSNTFVNANGTFNASSSNTNINASFAFTNDNTSTTVLKSWSSAASRYNSSTSIATTLSDTTTNYGGATVYGENLQIELPYNLKLTSYILAPVNTGRPKSWNIYGSSNSIGWTLIESRSDYTWTSNSPVTFTCSPAQTIFYKHFRLVIIKISDNTGIVSIANWNLLGTSNIDVNAVKFYNNNSIVNEETIQTITAAKTFSGGLTVSAGGLTVTAGGLTVSAGGLTVTAGGLTVTAGDLTITGGDLKTGSTTRISNAGAISNISTINTSGLITAGSGLTVTAGDLTITQGDLKTGSTTRISNAGEISNISTIITSGLITAGSGITVNGYITGQSINSITAQYQIQALSFNVSSDIRIKKNIEYQNTNSSLETIRLLKPAKYDFIDSKKKNCHGFLAQELEEILPSLITNTNNYIPNIFSNATVNGDGFKVTILNEKFSLFDLKNKENAKIEYTDASNNIFIANIKEIIDEKTFIVQEKIDFDTIFIKGEEIEDFKSIDPIQIISLNTASIIQLDKELSEAKNKIIELENKINELLK
jgi:hypothetical protein